MSAMGVEGLRTIFAEALENMDKNTKSIVAELEAIKIGDGFRKQNV